MRRKKQDIEKTFLEEQAKSAQFLKKLTKIKVQNKESKERTVINQHKVEWFNQMKGYQKREKVLEQEIEQFMEKFENMTVASNCGENTAKVRARIKEQESMMLESERQFNELNEDPDETRESSLNFFPTAVDDDFQTFDPESDEVFSIKDLRHELHDQKSNREDFEANLHESVRGIKQLTQ